MLVRGSRQETLEPGFVLLGTRRQGVLIILVLLDEFDLVSHSFTVRDNTSKYLNKFYFVYDKDDDDDGDDNDDNTE
ncbi:unnamed protein product [Schistosoma margrebowiei]|uniref:Uncharacterized protein n=1 Tax=Schistosoma margrebowiei TaxID=48269 RepID=A0A183LGJ1_9TREM|nr:unnamed protein product [Schistosoma margrebowiei]